MPHDGRCAPSAVPRTATDGPRQQRFPAYRAPLSRVCWRFGDRVGGVPAPGRRVPVPVGNAGLAVIRRTQPVSVPSRAARAAWPRRRPGRNRTPSTGIGPRAAALALTSPARVPAGQQTNIPETFLCMRGVPSMNLARAGDRTGRVLGWRRHGERGGDLVQTAAPLTLALAGVYLAQIGRAGEVPAGWRVLLTCGLEVLGSCVTEARHLDVRPSRESWGLDFRQDAGSRRHGGPQTWQPPDLPGRTAFLNCARTT